jgi:hypothetical protein
MAAVAPGSYLALSHGTYEHLPPNKVRAGVDMPAEAAENAYPRPRAEVERFFAGLDLVEPRSPRPAGRQKLMGAGRAGPAGWLAGLGAAAEHAGAHPRAGDEALGGSCQDPRQRHEGVIPISCRRGSLAGILKLLPMSRLQLRLHALTQMTRRFTPDSRSAPGRLSTGGVRAAVISCSPAGIRSGFACCAGTGHILWGVNQGSPL